MELQTQIRQSDAPEEYQFLTNFERWGLEEGLEQGLEQGRRQQARRTLRSLLEVRFGTVPDALVEKIESLTDLERLEALTRQVVTVSSLAEMEWD